MLSDFKAGIYLLTLSELTDAEIQDAPNEVKNIYTEFRECDDEIIELTVETIELAEAYLKHKILATNLP